MKLAHMRTAPGKEDQESPLLLRISSSESPASEIAVGPSFIFQQDNDPKHTSRLCKGCLTKKESDGVLRQMTWPPQSPDLNPIECSPLNNMNSNKSPPDSNSTIKPAVVLKISMLRHQLFQFLSSLQTVILKDNKLQQVTDIQPILQLPHLQELNIGGNLFTSFQTKDLLLNVSSGLKLLNVSDNAKLEKFSITTQIFPHLEMIDFSDSGQAAGLKWDIPDKTLLRNITQLDFSGTLIPFEEIQKVLQSLDSLMHLRLSYMETFIQKGLLATVCKIPTLRRLDLLYNPVANLGSKFVTCSQLNELDLTDTYMTELPKGSMRLMKSLRSLTLANNFLTSVPDDIRSLSSLEVLYLRDNRISELTCDDFINTTRLTELYLDYNHIAKLDRCVFENLNDLKVLDMSNNLLWTFGGAFKTGLQKLEFLNLNKHFVSILENGDFQGLGSLKYLDLASKHIARVKSNAFQGLNNLSTLKVSLPLEFENKFRSLQQLENLTVYFDTDGSFKSPHSNFYEDLFQLKSLKIFTVICRVDHYGFPFDIPMNILQTMKHLEDFTAENLYISAPDPDTFRNNPQLKRLTLSQTDLSDLGPELFQPIPNLQALDLSYSKLKSLDFLAQADLSALTFLKLSDNDITVINETVFQSLPALTYLDLDNNPFTCDCSNAGFIQWVKNNNQTQVVNAHMYTCSFPVVEQGNKLLDFDIQSCWMDVGFLCFICSTCLTLLTLLAAFVFHFLRWQLAYAYYLFLAFLYDSRKRKKNGAPHQYDAFISYNVHDEAWVYREMLPVLEGEQGWRLCLHHRDFQPVSPYYRMRKLVKGRTYLSWPQAGQHKGVFWQNVSRALETGDAPTETADLLTGPAGC
ncbi:toll-like receptor 13 [Micropterus dolomieu]|uniref:toll-like receptor 13 n=1 Tax=Micropterus dolomieu TaxID=147949 RepID=UPI001E8CB6C1|nr:toll-like receptor 13 [Micropterus dolomieu]